ncbi:hypothetical protein PGH12_02575 [Chryseobacterium wangxinyae]|uniref:hypothetical protein n=1 Tax=Chryseobacterium sp. CY350 TaxID=2997336 RepID=UPI00226F6731|nr:hypothetical protein [Chryseobacterium sp. CY350]MCY0978262.1 hypothetical protein [Chryseobacterium sp. CY350]WBZ96040.1 hypothetical protein PGH12_02575 [Chryseobacterium sp. CY350]
MKNILSKQFSLLLMLLSISGCEEKIESNKFDSQKWKPIENGLYGENHRKKMLDDLIKNVLVFPYNHAKKGTKKSEVINLIDRPISTDCNGYETYEIEEKQGWIDPNGFVRLKLMYDNDSTLLGYIIEDGNYAE